MITQSELKQLLSYDANTGEFTWLANSGGIHSGSRAGGTDRQGYIQITISGKKHQAHRLAWLYQFGTMPANQIDHINGKRSDNRISNLRDVTQHKNTFNRLNVRGYTWISSSRKWRARLALNGKDIHLGYFEHESDARAAYLQAKQTYHVI